MATVQKKRSVIIGMRMPQIWGYRYTGDFRAPRFDEYYLKDGELSVCKSKTMSKVYPIMEPFHFKAPMVETPAKPAVVVVKTATKQEAHKPVYSKREYPRRAPKLPELNALSSKLEKALAGTEIAH